MKKFIIVTVVFLVIFIAMVVVQVKDWWLWGAFVVLWTLAEWYYAKGVRLSWRQWAAIIAALFVIEAIVLVVT